MSIGDYLWKLTKLLFWLALTGISVHNFLSDTSFWPQLFHGVTSISSAAYVVATIIDK